MSTRTPRGGPTAALVRALWLIAGTLALALVPAATATAGPSSPSGGDAVYQVEISANVPGSQGGGSWFWLELDRDGTGVYAGSDGAHGSPVSPDRGTLTWGLNGDELTIHGVQSSGLPPFAYEPIIVPASYGHETESYAEVFPTLTAFLTSVGFDVSKGVVQVQVAP